MLHTFHIPVLGLGFSIDTPLKVARFGISSVVSIVDDELTERMRKYNAELHKQPYTSISKTEPDARAKRITAYLNLLDQIVKDQVTVLKALDFEEGNELCKYFELLPDDSVLKAKYLRTQLLPSGIEKQNLTAELKNSITTGSIDVNIMSKVDKANYNNDSEYLGDSYTDALAAMRGFAESTLNSAVVISAGLNPRLYAYMEQLDCFYPNMEGMILKKIILKVSDFRSAMIQAKMLAKKGLWISEFRIESGLNCGGHAFATEGFLIGPILEEFKEKRNILSKELHDIYSDALRAKGITAADHPTQTITAQGGIGTAEEHKFLLDHYQLSATGWGSPFLLVPETTNVDPATLTDLAEAKAEDFYISNSSPLGVLFNNFKKSTIEKQRLERIEKNRPGSPCTKKYLTTNTEFTELPICTASREYQRLKLQELDKLNLPKADYSQRFQTITEKACLCEGLAASAYLKNGILKPKESSAVAICPGPNLSYFSRKYSLKEMINHIYGRENLLSNVQRPNLFINELNLYIDYLKKDFANHIEELSTKKAKYFDKFKEELLNGIAYYKRMIPEIGAATNISIKDMYNQLQHAESILSTIFNKEAVC